MAMSQADSIQGIDRPVVMLSRQYTSGQETGWHKHSRIQFLYAEVGVMTAHTDDGCWVVPEGYGLIIPDGTHHTVKMFGDVVMHSAYILADAVALQNSYACSVIVVSPLLAVCLERLASLPNAYPEGDVADHLASLVIIEVAAAPNAEFVLRFPETAGLRAVTDALIKDAACVKSIDDWAQEIGMSRRSFTRAFKKEVGLSFIQWRRRLRFQAASQLIASGMPLSKAAAATGYSASSVLATMMRRLA